MVEEVNEWRSLAEVDKAGIRFIYDELVAGGMNPDEALSAAEATYFSQHQEFGMIV